MPLSSSSSEERRLEPFEVATCSSPLSRRGFFLMIEEERRVSVCVWSGVCECVKCVCSDHLATNEKPKKNHVKNLQRPSLSSIKERGLCISPKLFLTFLAHPCPLFLHVVWSSGSGHPSVFRAAFPPVTALPLLPHLFLDAQSVSDPLATQGWMSKTRRRVLIKEHLL